MNLSISMSFFLIWALIVSLILVPPSSLLSAFSKLRWQGWTLCPLASGGPLFFFGKEKGAARGRKGYEVPDTIGSPLATDVKENAYDRDTGIPGPGRARIQNPLRRLSDPTRGDLPPPVGQRCWHVSWMRLTSI